MSLDSALVRPLLALLLAASTAVRPVAGKLAFLHTHGGIGRLGIGLDDVRRVHQNHQNVGTTRFLMEVADFRSGSTMLDSLLDSHPQIKMSLEDYNCKQFGLACALHENLTQTHERLSRSAEPGKTWVGFKMMIYQTKNVPGTWWHPQENDNATLIFHFRRNILRTLISRASSHPCHPIGCTVKECTCYDFALNDEEAGKLAIQHRPTLKTDDLIEQIAAQLKTHRRIMQVARSHPSFNRKCISHYEDWINPAVRVAQSNAILTECLGLPPTNLTTGLIGINFNRPLLETVANPEQVKQALRGTRYAYMLEDATSPADIFGSLLETDVLDGSMVHF